MPPGQARGASKGIPPLPMHVGSSWQPVPAAAGSSSAARAVGRARAEHEL